MIRKHLRFVKSTYLRNTFTDKTLINLDNNNVLKNLNMNTNFNYNQLQQWSNKDLIEQVLLLQNHINNFPNNK